MRLDAQAPEGLDEAILFEPQLFGVVGFWGLGKKGWGCKANRAAVPPQKKCLGFRV